MPKKCRVEQVYLGIDRRVYQQAKNTTQSIKHEARNKKSISIIPLNGCYLFPGKQHNFSAVR